MSETMPQSLKLEELAWPDVQEARGGTYTTVVAAAGSTEQHGPHLPLTTDTLIGTELVAAIVERLGDALQGPTIPFGCSEHHMAFPGTITLERETFKAIVKEYARSIARHGFRTIYFVPSHGGNFAPLAEAVAELGGKVERTRVIAFTDLAGFLDVIYASQQPYNVTPEVAGAHAGNTETALVLATRPELARMERVEAGFVGDFNAEAQATVFREGMRALTANGILGDPHGADAARGRDCLNALANYLADYLRQTISGEQAVGTGP